MLPVIIIIIESNSAITKGLFRCAYAHNIKEWLMNTNRIIFFQIRDFTPKHFGFRTVWLKSCRFSVFFYF